MIQKKENPIWWMSLLLAGTLFASCSGQEEAVSVESSFPILLCGSVGGGDLSASTRGVIDAASTASLDLSFARRDQQTGGAYPSYATIGSSLNATRAAVAGNVAGVITFASGSEQYYLVRDNDNATALIGWYPRVSSGSTYAAGKVTFAGIAGGVTDVMFTKEQTGNKTTGVSAFTFEHLLSQIQIKAKAVDASASARWGKITGVTLKSVKTGNCVVTLPTAAPTADALTPDFGSTVGNITLKALNNDATTVFTEAIPATAGTVGTSFCYALFPPTGGSTLTLDVATEIGGTRTVTATLSSGTVTSGNIYTVTLEFKSTDITPTATISSWGTGSGANVSL